MDGRPSRGCFPVDDRRPKPVPPLATWFRNQVVLYCHLG